VHSSNCIEDETLGEADYSVPEPTKPMSDFAPFLIGFFLVWTAVSFVGWVIQNLRAKKETTERVEAAEKRIDESPGKSKFAWDLARITLESYFDRNLRHVSAIFWLSVFVMLIGVGIILWGITIAVQAKDNATSLAAIITGASGVITE